MKVLPRQISRHTIHSAEVRNTFDKLYLEAYNVGIRGQNEAAGNLFRARVDVCDRFGNRHVRHDH